MGTINEKISYLAETKQRQKNLINALGGNITNDTPFREYEKELVGVLPKVTGEGTNISLSPTIEYDLDISTYKGDTIQDGTPTPEIPIPIQVVTGTQEIKKEGKNLIDFSKFELTSTSRGTISTTTSSVTINLTGQFMAYVTSIPISNKTYKLSVGSITGSSAARIEYRVYKNGTQIGSTATTTSNATIDNTSGNYDEIKISLSNATTTNTDITFNDLQLEVGTSVTSYEPYKSQTYTLHLGDLELAKIGTYQDKIYFNNGKWYKENVIRKLISTGGSDETWGISNKNTSNWYYYRTITTDVVANTNSLCKTNYYIHATITSTSETQGIGVYANYIRIRYGTEDTTENYRTWLSTHNLITYYPVNTPTTTEITNETLLSDLEYIRTHTMSYSGTTNISSSGNLPVIISARALKGE